MPIYEYRCTDCGFQKEYLQKMSDAPPTDCPECGKATLAKMVTAAGFHLKGSGWYATDFKHGPKSKSKPDDQAATKADDKAGAKAEDKSAAKGDDKSADTAPANPKSSDKAAPEAPAKKSGEAAPGAQSGARATPVSS